MSIAKCALQTVNSDCSFNKSIEKSDSRAAHKHATGYANQGHLRKRQKYTKIYEIRKLQEEVVFSKKISHFYDWCRLLKFEELTDANICGFDNGNQLEPEA